MPHFIPPDCQNLLCGMIEVDPLKRLTVSNKEYVPSINVSIPEINFPAQMLAPFKLLR